MRTTPVVALCLALLTLPGVLAHNPAGTPKVYCEPQPEWGLHEYAPPAAGLLVSGVQDGNAPGACAPSFPSLADDGHKEFAFGGARILAAAAAEACYGDIPHHTAKDIFVVDASLGASVTVVVGIDTTPPCGDLLIDATETFIGGGTVTLPAGADGAYFVMVRGTQGHVFWP